MRAFLSLCLALLLALTQAFPQGGVCPRTPIEHVVILILENHSFDDLFGLYPLGTPPLVNNVTLSLMRPLGLNTSVTLPKDPDEPSQGGVSPYYSNSVIQDNPDEGYHEYLEDWDGGAMDGFVQGSGPQSMAYLSYQQVPLLWDYAEEYVLADNYFSPVLGVTQPNRLAYLTGYPTQVNGDSLVQGVIPFQDTILFQLSQHGISWGYFDYGYVKGQSLPPFPLAVLKGAQDYSSHYWNTDAFLNDLRTGELPSVSFLSFTGGGGTDSHSALDFHPPFNLTQGQVNLAYFLDKIMESPYWNSTVIFVTFDEGGGFYDQVPPPVVYTFGAGTFPAFSSLGNYSLLGQRVPLLVISPYAREGWVDNYSLSGYSLLAFLDYNWGLPYLSPLVEHSDVQGILKAFDFSRPPRPPLPLGPGNWSYPTPLQYPIHYGYTALVKGNYTGYWVLYKAGLTSLKALGYVMTYQEGGGNSSVSGRANAATLNYFEEGGDGIWGGWILVIGVVMTSICLLGRRRGRSLP